MNNRVSIVEINRSVLTLVAKPLLKCELQMVCLVGNRLVTPSAFFTVPITARWVIPCESTLAEELSKVILKCVGVLAKALNGIAHKVVRPSKERRSIWRHPFTYLLERNLCRWSTREAEVVMRGPYTAERFRPSTTISADDCKAIALETF